MTHVSVPGPALGLLELESLARGMTVADTLVKKAHVRLALTEAVSPGKYLLLFTGGEANVEEAFRAGLDLGGSSVLDRLHLPHVAEAVLEALSGRFALPGANDALGIVETHTVAAALLSSDKALKAARVKLVQLQLARGIGGKGWFTLAGEQHDIEAALEAAVGIVQPALLVATEIIQRPHPDFRAQVFR